METTMQTENKLLKVKHAFDSLTSEHGSNWKLVLFWIFIFEIIATIFEYLFIGHSVVYEERSYNDNLTAQFAIGLTLTGFLWASVYNFIFFNKKNFLYLVLFGTAGLYLIITNDIYLEFLFANINPLHIFDLSFSFALLIELVFKFIIIYLIYQLIMSIKNAQKSN